MKIVAKIGCIALLAIAACGGAPGEMSKTERGVESYVPATGSYCTPGVARNVIDIQPYINPNDPNDPLNGTQVVGKFYSSKDLRCVSPSLGGTARNGACGCRQVGDDFFTAGVTQQQESMKFPSGGYTCAQVGGNPPPQISSTLTANGTNSFTDGWNWNWYLARSPQDLAYCAQ